MTGEELWKVYTKAVTAIYASTMSTGQLVMAPWSVVDSATKTVWEEMAKAASDPALRLGAGTTPPGDTKLDYARLLEAVSLLEETAKRDLYEMLYKQGCRIYKS